MYKKTNGIVSRGKRFNFSSRNFYLTLLTIPGIIIIILFSYLPMYGVLIAFKKYNPGLGIIGSPWAGLYYFKSFFNDIFAWRIFRNSLLFGSYSLIFTFPAPIILALLLNEVKAIWFKRTIQTITYLPYFVAVMIIVGIMKEMFSPVNGVINILLKDAFGVNPINFFAISSWFRPLYIGSALWQNVGFNAILYLAALSGINPEIYESAIIDGAGRLQKIWYVTIPGILPTAVILFILSVGGIMGNDYTKILLMYSPATYETADVISTYVYRIGIENANYSYASAVGLLVSIISVFSVLITNYISRKVTDNSLW